MAEGLDAERAGTVTFGLSLERETAERIDALLGVKPRKRSERYAELIVAGMAERYGDDWAEKADRLRGAEVAA